MELGRYVLDQQVIDVEDRPMGRVDGVVIELQGGGTARVAALVIGGTTLLWRLHPRLAAWVERRRGDRGHVDRIPWRRVVKIGVDIKVDVRADERPALYWERWVRDRIIRRIPGA